MRLIPREEKFFDLFEELSNKIEEGGKLFQLFVENYENPQAKAAKIKEVEHEADVITHRTYEKMHTSFLTPIDREDIYTLVNKMDSILDLIEASTARMHLYKIKKPTDEIRAMAKVLNACIAGVKQIVHGLRDLKNTKMMSETSVAIHTLENEGDMLLRGAVAKLFEEQKDVFELIKWKEIYERIEEAIDICEDVSNIVEGIVLKHG
jgi:predicted phosphate transport protein (TIGR00153 family)